VQARSEFGSNIKDETMDMTTKRVLFWLPRLLCVLFVMFLSMFALDVFSESHGFREALFAFIIHLVPTYIVIIALAPTLRVEANAAGEELRVREAQANQRFETDTPRFPGRDPHPRRWSLHGDGK
jgi:hypothetical protein